MKMQLGMSLILSVLSIFPLKGQLNIAVMEFEGKGMTAVEASILTDRLRTELFRTKRFVVLEREMMEEILSEQGFQQTGCTTAECVVEIGRLVGVEQIVGGSVIKFGSLYSISARIISVETGKIIKTATYDHEGRLEDLLKFGMKKVAYDLAEEKPVALEEKPEASEPKEVITVAPPLKEIKPPSKNGTKSPIVTKRRFFWGNSYLHEGKKLKKRDLHALLKTDPEANIVFEASMRNRLIGDIMLFGGTIYNNFIYEAIDGDYYADIFPLASIFGGWYFGAKGNKQFLDAINIYNNNIE